MIRFLFRPPNFFSLVLYLSSLSLCLSLFPKVEWCRTRNKVWVFYRDPCNRNYLTFSRCVIPVVGTVFRYSSYLCRKATSRLEHVCVTSHKSPGDYWGAERERGITITSSINTICNTSNLTT